MSKGITQERWDIAQKAERECHDRFLNKDGADFVRKHYKGSYDRYFHYLGLNYDQTGKTIVEIGCADYPALEHCKVGTGVLVEPMPSPTLINMVRNREDLLIIQKPWEEIKTDGPSKSDEDVAVWNVNEIWLLNVLQHVVDPDLFIEKCKEAADVIRFFEPIDWPIEIYHPHTFDFEYFKGHFPEAIRYNGTEKGFHTAHCAYGVWRKDK